MLWLLEATAKLHAAHHVPEDYPDSCISTAAYAVQQLASGVGCFVPLIRDMSGGNTSLTQKGFSGRTVLVSSRTGLGLKAVSVPQTAYFLSGVRRSSRASPPSRIQYHGPGARRADRIFLNEQPLPKASDNHFPFSSPFPLPSLSHHSR